MAEVVYPPPTAQKILTLEAPGGRPETLQLVAPSITRPGQPFVLKLAVADHMGYPSVEVGGAVTIRGDFASPASVRLPFAKGQPAVAEVHGVAIGAEGLYRFEAELDGRTFHSNPTRCTAEVRSPVFWGDPHVHTVLSRCHPERCRSVQFCYAAARYFAGLDFASAADHVSNDRCDLGKWKESAAASDLHDDPPHFATLPAYEASFQGGAGGDNNPYMRRWPENFVDDFEDGTVKTLCGKLAEYLPESDFFVVPHHTTRMGKHGEIPDAIYPGPDLMPVVEIHSKWGTSEYRGNPNPLRRIHDGPSYVVDLLGRGLRLGFIGGTDTHSTMPAGFGNDHLPGLPGMTAVFADGLSRDAVFDAMRTRRCYAASLERILLDVRVAGAAMGEMMPWPDSPRPREVRVAAAGRSDVTAVEIVRNGETVGQVAADGWHAEGAWTDTDDLAPRALESKYLGRFAYYYVRVTCASGAQAWSSPVWLRLEP